MSAVWWWLRPNKHGARIWWKNEPQDPSAHVQARTILDAKASVPKGTSMGSAPPPRLRPVGKINGIECFVEAIL